MHIDLGKHIHLDFGVWDFSLLVVVVSMSLLLAYLRTPRLKALVLMMPIPFTLATLMVGKGVTVSTVFGVFTLILFTTCVRLLHTKAGWPIVRTLAVCLFGYCVIGVLIAQFVPDSDWLFWSALIAMVITGFVCGAMMPHREEPHHRTPLPVWKKAPIIFCVVVLLVCAKKLLEGFTQTFPMVGLVGNYEARHSLWTVNRSLIRSMVPFSLMFIPIRVLMPKHGVGFGLSVGWAGYLLALGVLIWQDRRDARRLGMKADDDTETGETLGA